MFIFEDERIIQRRRNLFRETLLFRLLSHLNILISLLFIYRFFFFPPLTYHDARFSLLLLTESRFGKTNRSTCFYRQASWRRAK